MPRDDGIALSEYDAALVVAALCRYASQADVHPAHRDRCGRLARALADERSVTLTAATGSAVAGGVGTGVATADGAEVPGDGTAADATTPRAADEDPFLWGPDRADG